MLHGLRRAWDGRTKRPVVVTGYVGVVYEKLADGLLLRHGADLVLANSRQDADRFRAVYEGVGADASSVTEVALPFLGGRPYAARDPSASKGAGPTRSSSPSSRPCRTTARDRTYLLNRLVGHARLHPDREVLLKLRSRPGEHTTHIEELPYQKLAENSPRRSARQLPPGVREHGRGPGQHRPAGHRQLHGRPGVAAPPASPPRSSPTSASARPSATTTSSAPAASPPGTSSTPGTRPVPDPRVAWPGRASPPGAPDGTARTHGLRRRPRPHRRAASAAAGLPPLAPYYTPVTAPGYLPGILARHHLGPDGDPLPGAPAAERQAGPVRQIVRRAARGAYRHGVQRVAPVIRRMGEL